MRLKIAVVALALALASVTAFLVWAQIILQEDTTTGRVTVTGDFLEVSPATDWLVVESFGGAATSGIQELTFTNTTNNDAMLVSLMRTEMVVSGPDPTVFDGTLTLEIGDNVEGPCNPLTMDPVLLPPGSWIFFQPIPAGAQFTLCGALSYDGSLGPVNEAVNLTFMFDSELHP